jgi:hypothetical protein
VARSRSASSPASDHAPSPTGVTGAGSTIARSLSAATATIGEPSAIVARARAAEASAYSIVTDTASPRTTR